ncbi:MAG: hypothetical protein WD180_01220 [Pseudohongiellaceae bacterium]
MSIVKIILQLVGLVVLIPAVAMATLRFENRDDDGPSVLFPGGELVSGELYSGPEPDWSFTGSIQTIELELEDSGSSRLIWILDADGRAYVVSGYMNTFLGRLWKQWAVDADEGSGLAVVRIDGVRYERQLERIQSGDELDGVAASVLRKYSGGEVTPENIAQTRAGMESGASWVFRLAPRGS